MVVTYHDNYSEEISSRPSSSIQFQEAEYCVICPPARIHRLQNQVDFVPIEQVAASHSVLRTDWSY